MAMAAHSTPGSALAIWGSHAIRLHPLEKCFGLSSTKNYLGLAITGIFATPMRTRVEHDDIFG